MRGVRLGLAVGIVVVLAVVVVAAWGDGGGSGVGSVTTSSTAVGSSVVGSSSTSVVGSSSVSTSSTTSTSGPRDRVAEVEGILRGLWFGWFDAIYRKDPDALWEVVATEKTRDDAVATFDLLEFSGPPSWEGTKITVKEILLDRSDCLVVFQRGDFTAYRGPGAVGETVSVLWPDEDGSWRIAALWSGPGDLWRTTCDLVTRESTP